MKKEVFNLCELFYFSCIYGNINSESLCSILIFRVSVIRKISWTELFFLCLYWEKIFRSSWSYFKYYRISNVFRVVIYMSYVLGNKYKVLYRDISIYFPLIVYCDSGCRPSVPQKGERLASCYIAFILSLVGAFPHLWFSWKFLYGRISAISSNKFKPHVRNCLSSKVCLDLALGNWPYLALAWVSF